MKQCLECAIKHLSYADVLVDESRMGYPRDVWKAVGQLTAAEAHTVWSYRSIAQLIRAERLRLMDDPYDELGLTSRVDTLLRWVVRAHERETGLRPPGENRVSLAEYSAPADDDDLPF